MAKRKPSITPEERDRNRRAADERQRARAVEEAKVATLAAQAWLVAHGVLVPGEGVRDRLRRLDQYRQSLVQASAPAYKPTARQIGQRPIPGIFEEIDF